MSEISSINVVGISARYAAQIRELLAARADQRDREEFFSGAKQAAQATLPSCAIDDGRVDELA